MTKSIRLSTLVSFVSFICASGCIVDLDGTKGDRVANTRNPC